MRKQEGAHRDETKEQGYKVKQNMNRILIVDDEPDITLAFEQGLRDKGFEQVDTLNDPLLDRFIRFANY